MPSCLWVAHFRKGLVRLPFMIKSCNDVKPLFVPLLELASSVSLGVIYVVGGISHEGVELSSVEAYNPISKCWSTLPPMGNRRAYLGVAALNDCIYSIGGWNETQDTLNSVEKYSFEEVR